MKNKKLSYCVKIAILSAIACVVMLFEFPLVFIAPEFYKLDLSDTVALMSGFALGPVAGVITELLKNILKIIIKGTATGFVGELANFTVGVCFVLPAGLIYKKKKSLKSAIASLSVGTVMLGIGGSIMNYFVMLPFYSKFMPLEQIISLGNSIIPLVNGKLTFVLFCVLPFNLIKGILCSAICFILYKRLSKILHI